MIIIGGGSGGATAAATAVDLNKKVLLVEERYVGGTCTNTGCVPTKTNLYAASLVRAGRRLNNYGLDNHRPTVNFKAVRRHQRQIVEGIRAAGEQNLRRLGIPIEHGTARLVDPNTVSIDGRDVTADYIVIATGASPAVPPIDGLDTVPFLTSTSALERDELPLSVIVIGGSYIGLEFATFYNTFGTQTTVLEAEDRIARTEDAELSAFIEDRFTRQGVSVVTGVNVSKVARDGEHAVVTGSKGGRETVFEADAVFLATGRTPNIRKLNLKGAGVKYGKKGIEVNEFLQTSVEPVYAVGDITPSPQLEHVAVYEGWLAVNNMFSADKQKAEYGLAPTVIFTDPELAHVGQTEEQAKQSADVLTMTYPYRAMAAAQISEETDGLMKLVVDAEDGTLLGVHIAGNDAGNLVHLGLLAMQFALPVGRIAEAVSAYPTLAQGFFIACQFLDEKLSERRAA